MWTEYDLFLFLALTCKILHRLHRHSALLSLVCCHAFSCTHVGEKNGGKNHQASLRVIFFEALAFSLQTTGVASNPYSLVATKY